MLATKLDRGTPEGIFPAMKDIVRCHVIPLRCDCAGACRRVGRAQGRDSCGVGLLQDRPNAGRYDLSVGVDSRNARRVILPPFPVEQGFQVFMDLDRERVGENILDVDTAVELVFDVCTGRKVEAKEAMFKSSEDG